MAFFDFIDNGLKALGIDDEVNDFSSAMKGFVTPIQQGIADVAKGGLAANLGEDIGTGLGQMGERIQSYDPLGYLGSNDQSGTPKWQRPWEIAGDTLGELAAPAGQYWQENVAPDILGAGLATVRQAEVPQDELSKYWHESANTLPWGVEGLFEELTNPLNYVGFGLGGKVPLAGRVLGPADRLVGKALSLPVTVPLNLAGKALKATGITALSEAGKAARGIGQVERALSELGGNNITIDKLQSLLDNPTTEMLSVSDRSIKTLLDNSEVLKSAIGTAAKRNKPLVDLVHYTENTLKDVELANKLRSTELLSDVVKEAYSKNDPALNILADKVKGMVKEGQYENAVSQLADPIRFVADDISKLIRKQYGLGGNERNPLLRLYGDSTKILKQLWLTTPAFHIANYLDDTMRAILGAGPGVLRGPRNVEDIIRGLDKGDIGLGIGGFTGKTKLGPTGKEGLEKIPVAGKIVEASRKFGEWRESYTRAAIGNNFIMKELPGLEKSIFSRLSTDLLSAGMEPNSVRSIVGQLNTMKSFGAKDIIEMVRKYSSVGDGIIPPSIGDITDLHYGSDFIKQAQDAVNKLDPMSATYRQDMSLAAQKVLNDLKEHIKTASVDYSGEFSDLLPEVVRGNSDALFNQRQGIIKSHLLDAWKELEASFFNEGKSALRSTEGVEPILTELLNTLYKYDDEALRLAPTFEDHAPAYIDAFNRKLIALESAKNVISQSLGMEQVRLGLPEDSTVATKMREIFKYLSDSTTKAQEVSKSIVEARLEASSRAGSLEANKASVDYYTQRLANDIKFIQDKLGTNAIPNQILPNQTQFQSVINQAQQGWNTGIPSAKFVLVDGSEEFINPFSTGINRDGYITGRGSFVDPDIIVAMKDIHGNVIWQRNNAVLSNVSQAVPSSVLSYDEFIKQRPELPTLLYHGSPEGQLKGADPNYATKLWREGQGFYTTDSREAALEYAKGRTAQGSRKAGAQSQGVINYVDPPKVPLDMDAPIDRELWEEASKVIARGKLTIDDIDFYAKGGKSITNQDAYKSLRDALSEEVGGDNQAAGWIEEYLNTIGYDATTHTEGLGSRNPHKVTIFIEEPTILSEKDAYDFYLQEQPTVSNVVSSNVSQPNVGQTSLDILKKNIAEQNNKLDTVNQGVVKGFNDTAQVLEQFIKSPPDPVYTNHSAESAVRANSAAGKVAKEWANITTKLMEDTRDLINNTAYNYAESLNIDRLLKLVSPFTVWQTRNIPTYMKLLAQHPGMINAMNIYEGESEKQQAGKNMSSRFEGMVQLPGGQGWWVDPRNMVSMASQMKEPFTLEGNPGQEGATEFGKGVGTVQKMLGGVGMWPWLQYPMLLTGQQGQMPFPQISPTTRLIQGLTGYNMEQPIQKALETTRANITGTEPPISESMFLDSAINRRLSEWVAEKKITNAQAQRAMDNPNDKLYKDAETQVRNESDKATLARFMQPFSIKYQGQGEQIIRSLQQELKDRFGGRSYSQLTKQEQNDFNAFKNQNASLRAYDSAFKDPAVREIQIQNDEYWNIGPQWLRDAASDYSSKSTKEEKTAWIKKHSDVYDMLKTEYWNKRDEYLDTHPDLAKYMNYDRSKEGKTTIDSYIAAQKDYKNIPSYRQWRESDPTKAPAPEPYEPKISKPKAPTEEQVVWNTYWYLKNNNRTKEAAGYLKLNQSKLKTPLKY